MRLDFECSEDEEGLFKVISDTFMSMEVILFKLLALVLLIVFSNAGFGSDFSALELLFIRSRSIFYSKDVIADRFMSPEAIIFR